MRSRLPIARAFAPGSGQAMKERRLHLVFLVALWTKAAFAVAEIIGGIATAIVTREFLLRLAVAMTREELGEDPRDVVANALLHAARHLSIGAKTFAAVYLLSHGLVKLWLVAGLLRGRLWSYPTAIFVFLGFIGYQTYRWALQHSILLLALTILDVVVVALTWREWRFRRKRTG